MTVANLSGVQAIASIVSHLQAAAPSQFVIPSDYTVPTNVHGLRVDSGGAVEAEVEAEVIFPSPSEVVGALRATTRIVSSMLSLVTGAG